MTQENCNSLGWVENCFSSRLLALMKDAEYLKDFLPELKLIFTYIGFIIEGALLLWYEFISKNLESSLIHFEEQFFQIEFLLVIFSTDRGRGSARHDWRRRTIGDFDGERREALPAVRQHRGPPRARKCQPPMRNVLCIKNCRRGGSVETP